MGVINMLTVIIIDQWWDTRNFTEAIETVILDLENKDPESPGEVDRALTPCTLEYDPTIPARYMVTSFIQSKGFKR